MSKEHKGLNILGRIKFNAPVTLSFALISLGALILNNATKGKSNEVLFSTYRAGFLNPLM